MHSVCSACVPARGSAALEVSEKLEFIKIWVLNKAGTAPGASPVQPVPQQRFSASPWQGGVGDGALPVLAEGWDNLGLPPTLCSSAFPHKVPVLLLTQGFFFFFLLCPEDIFL